MQQLLICRKFLRQFVLGAFLATAFAAGASAADISGTWKGTAPTPFGPSERTFVFKAVGKELTGETSSALLGKSTITDGRIEGNKISFSFVGKGEGFEVKLNYTGTVDGNEIKVHVESTDGSVNIDYTIKKVS